MKVIIFIAVFTTIYGLSIPDVIDNTNSTIVHLDPDSSESSHDLETLLKNSTNHDHPINSTLFGENYLIIILSNKPKSGQISNVTKSEIVTSLYEPPDLVKPGEKLTREIFKTEWRDSSIDKVRDNSTILSNTTSDKNTTENMTMSKSKVTREVKINADEKKTGIIGIITLGVKKLLNHTDTLLKPVDEVNKNNTPMDARAEKTPIARRQVVDSVKPRASKNETTFDINKKPVHSVPTKTIEAETVEKLEPMKNDTKSATIPEKSNVNGRDTISNVQPIVMIPGVHVMMKRSIETKDLQDNLHSDLTHLKITKNFTKIPLSNIEMIKLENLENKTTEHVPSEKNRERRSYSNSIHLSEDSYTNSGSVVRSVVAYNDQPAISSSYSLPSTRSSEYGRKKRFSETTPSNLTNKQKSTMTGEKLELNTTNKTRDGRSYGSFDRVSGDSYESSLPIVRSVTYVVHQQPAIRSSYGSPAIRSSGYERRKRSSDIDTSKITPVHVTLTKDQFKASIAADKLEFVRTRDGRSYGRSISEIRESGDLYGGSTEVVRSLNSYDVHQDPAIVRSSDVRSSGYGRNKRSSEIHTSKMTSDDIEPTTKKQDKSNGTVVKSELENKNSRDRRSYSTSASEIREFEDSFSESNFPSSMKFAVRRKPALRSKFEEREAPIVRSSSYGSEFLKTPIISEVRDFPIVRSSSDDFEVPISRSLGRHSRVRDAPVVRSSSFGSEIRDIPISRSLGHGSRIREAPAVVRSFDYDSEVPEAPVVRSSSYGSEVLEVPIDSFGSYGSNVRSSDFESLRELPLVRSSNHAPLVREFEDAHFSHGSSVRVATNDIPAVRISFNSGVREGPPIRSNYDSQVREAPVVVRESPAVRSSYASRIREVPAVRSVIDDLDIREDDEDEFRSGRYISDLSDLKLSEDIPIVRSEYDVSPIRVSMEPLEVRDDDRRYKRSIEEPSSNPSSSMNVPKTLRTISIVHSIPGKVTRSGSF